jgi:purine-binding chemotaxis protein CheW
MSRRPTKPPSRLPESGLAQDILRMWKERAEEPSPEVAEPPAATPPSAGDLEGPERLFVFSDRLAQRQEAPKAQEAPETWVSFQLGAEIFALPVACVLEIQRITSLTRVPHAPAPVRGITNLRGRVLAVVDLRVRLGLPPAEVTPNSRLIIVEARSRSIGLLVDGARQIVKLLPSRVQEAPADVRTIHSDFLRGVYSHNEDLLILLDLERVLWIPGELAAAWSTQSTAAGADAQRTTEDDRHEATDSSAVP